MVTSTVRPNQTASNVTVNSGDYLFVSSGATVINGSIAAGASVYVNAAAVLSGSIRNGGRISGGTLQGPDTTLTNSAGGSLEAAAIGSGAVVTNSGYMTSVVVASGGIVNTYSGPVTSTIVQGGTLNCYERNIISGITFAGQGGTVNLMKGVVQTAPFVFSGNGTVYVQSGAVMGMASVGPGATMEILGGGVISSTTTVSSGGTLILNDNTTNRGTIQLDGNGATIVVNGTQMPAGPITGWSANDKIILKGIPRSSIVRAYVGTAGVTFYTKDGNSYTVPIFAASSYGYSITQDENGNAVFLTCFAEGTLIRTPMGEVAVEHLCEGQLVDTPKGPMPVKWIGHRTLEVLKQPEPENCWLVRIRKDALGDNIPARDLLVTQEHCMVFDGQLVPARMLVNDQSIYLDRSLTQYRYFHVELDQHEAIWAEGALTESYLDTGNREQFANAPLTILSPQFCASGSSTLPLETSRDFVEPIYEALLARIGRSMEKPVLSHDPKLHLCTEDGRVIQPARVGPAGYVFMIPDSVASVRLMSKTGCPAAVIGPYVDDRRELGVAVEEISLFSTSGMQALDTIFDTPVIEGWHAPEGARHRWTNGAAHLALGADRTQRVLNIRLAAVGPYAETATASSGPVPSAITCANENARGTTALQRRMSV